MFAVAGSGKTTYIVKQLAQNKRSLIVTYTTANCDNLRRKITEKFNGIWPSNVTLLSYFSFLYGFCYKPFLSDRYKTRGVIYKPNPNRFERQTDLSYFMTENRYLYSNRLSLFMEKECILGDIGERVCKYFDEFIANKAQIGAILMDNQIIKLHYQNGAKAGTCHKNWGETKGEDCYQDVCVMLNKKTASERAAGRLSELPQSTKNKLYVAITRAKGNVYLVNK